MGAPLDLAAVLEQAALVYWSEEGGQEGAAAVAILGGAVSDVRRAALLTIAAEELLHRANTCAMEGAGFLQEGDGSGPLVEWTCDGCAAPHLQLYDSGECGRCGSARPPPPPPSRPISWVCPSCSGLLCEDHRTDRCTLCGWRA